MSWEASKNSKDALKLLQENPSWRLIVEYHEEDRNILWCQIKTDSGQEIRVHSSTLSVLSKKNVLKLISKSKRQIVRDVEEYEFDAKGKSPEVIDLEAKLRDMASKIHQMSKELERLKPKEKNNEHETGDETGLARTAGGPTD